MQAGPQIPPERRGTGDVHLLPDLPGTNPRFKPLTSLSIRQVMGGPIHGLLLLVLAPVAAVVVVVVALLRGHALQGVLVEVHGVRALRGQRGDRALHGACVRDGLQGTARDTQGEGRRRPRSAAWLPAGRGSTARERGKEGRDRNG